jgi:hypothetical protein
VVTAAIDDFIKNTEGLSERFQTLMSGFREPPTWTEFIENFKATPEWSRLSGAISFVDEGAWRAALQGLDLQSAIDWMVEHYDYAIGSDASDRAFNMLMAAAADALGEVGPHAAEDFMQAFRAAAGLEAALKIDPLKEVREARDVEEGGTFRVLNDALTELEKVATAYDGSLKSLQMLTGATAEARNAQIEYAAALYGVRDATHEGVGSLTRSIRESLMTPEQLYRSRSGRLDDITAEIRGTNSPEKIAELASEAMNLVSTISSGLTEAQMKRMAPGLIEFLEGLDALVYTKTGEGLDYVGGTETRVQDAVAKAVQTAADAQQDAADKQNEAADRFGEAVDTFADWAVVLRQAGIGGPGTDFEERLATALVKAGVTNQNVDLTRFTSVLNTAGVNFYQAAVIFGQVATWLRNNTARQAELQG